MNRIDKAKFYADLDKNLSDTGIKEIGRIKDLDQYPLSEDSRLSIGMECLDRDLWDYKPAMDNLKPLGIKYARLQSGWAKTEKEKGKYDFAWLDQVVDALLEIHIQPWLSLSYGNYLYAEDGAEEKVGGLGHVPLNSEEAKTAWKNYVDAVVKRYAGKITCYEVWNEPEVGVFFPYGDEWPQKYVELVALTSSVIRENDPNARIIACSASNFGISSYKAEKTLSLGLGKHIDIFACHGYRVLPEQMNEKARHSYRLLFDKYAPNVEIWQGESGIPSYNAPTSYGALSNMRVSEEIQAIWTARRIVCDLADRNLKRISYFHLYDFTHFSKMHNYYYGILRQEDYSRKPSYDVLQLLSLLCDRECSPNEMASMELWPVGNVYGLSETDLLAGKCFAFDNKEHTYFVYWYPDKVDDKPKVQSVSIGYWRNDFKKFINPVIVDTITRRIYEVELTDPENWIKAAPITSYPLILCEYDAIKDYADIQEVPKVKNLGTGQDSKIIGG